MRSVCAQHGAFHRAFCPKVYARGHRFSDHLRSIFRTLFTSSKFAGWIVCAKFGVRAIYFVEIRNDIFFAFGNPNVKHDSSCLLSLISV